MSPAARKKIAAAQRKRGALLKAKKPASQNTESAAKQAMNAEAWEVSC
jgi:hypothetical protein